MKKKIFFIILILTLLIFITGISIYYILDSKKVNPNYEKASILNQVTIKNEMNEDLLGYLTISSIGLENAPIKEGISNDVLNSFIGHFEDSNFLDGNVALCSHNRGYEKNYFENLKNIKNDDEIIYQTKYETKTYKVSEIKEIKDTDVDIIAPTQENKITLITCVENKGNKRLCVIGNEVKQ